MFSGSKCAGALCLLLASTFPAIADEQPSFFDRGMEMFDSGKLLATGGVSSIEGAGGGGLATWAVISGYGTRDGFGVNAHYTYVPLNDYTFSSPGISFGIFDRVELSYAYQTFDTENVGAALGLGQGFEFHQHVLGAKIKIFGDAVYEQDTMLPQVAIGVQYKSNDRAPVVKFVGAKSGNGTDYYIAATKLFLEHSLLVNVTGRLTKANQFGILGFGGNANDDYTVQFEGSAAYLISRKFAVGAEYRTKPNNLLIAKENNAWDVFAAYFLNKNLSLTVGYADLGNIVIKDNQHGAYLSLQAGL